MFKLSAILTLKIILKELVKMKNIFTASEKGLCRIKSCVMADALNPLLVDLDDLIKFEIAIFYTRNIAQI